MNTKRQSTEFQPAPSKSQHSHANVLKTSFPCPFSKTNTDTTQNGKETTKKRLPPFRNGSRASTQNLKQFPHPECWKFGSRTRLPRWGDTLVGLPRRKETKSWTKIQHFHTKREAQTSLTTAPKVRNNSAQVKAKRRPG